MGLAEHIHHQYLITSYNIILTFSTELHLLTYKQKMLEYVQKLGHQIVSPFHSNTLTAFSPPSVVDGYCDNYVTNDLITHIVNKFSKWTRKKESEKYLQTLSGEWTRISMIKTLTSLV
jgi:hypothetical protein